MGNQHAESEQPASQMGYQAMLKPYEKFTAEELAYAIDYAKRSIRRLERSQHERAGWSARVLRRNVKRMEQAREAMAI